MGFTIAGGIGLSGATASAAGGAIDAVAAAGLSAGLGAALAKKPAMPPSPVQTAEQLGQESQAADLAAQRRQSIAGGMTSTVGTSGGQAGQMLNPINMQSKTLLGQ